MADAWDLIAELRIQKAIENGAFSNLPGRGKAVEITEDFSIPWTVRWLLRKSTHPRVSSNVKHQPKAITSHILTGDRRRTKLNELVKRAREVKAVKSSKPFL